MGKNIQMNLLNIIVSDRLQIPRSANSMIIFPYKLKSKKIIYGDIN